MPQRQRVYSHQLSGAEVDQIKERLALGFAQGHSVYSCWFDALDDGDPIASQSTWYRIAKAWLNSQRPTRTRKQRRASSMPQFEATTANQVWCWDITKLAGPYIGISYDLYAVIDAFSRYVVAWRIEAVENDEMARDMFDAAITAQGQAPQIVHSDGGGSMMSKQVAALYADHGITRSRNRPRVSNDNPYIESWFKTAKYRPDYPQWFSSLDQARDWAATAIDDYNHHHHHSSLEGHCPAAIHHGTWQQVHQRRQETLNALAARNPHRWRHQPALKTPYAAVTLNTENTRERLQTA